MNTNESIISEALLWRYFAGQATGNEIDMLAAWVRSNETHKAEFQRVKELFYSTTYAPLRNSFDGKNAFADFQKSTQKTAKSITFRSWFAVAAVVAILLGSSIFFVLKQQIKPSQSSISFACNSQQSTYSLPDKSIVEFNKKSSLQYRTDVSEKRLTQLTGEAYFDIKHDAPRPFEIEAGKIKVQVLGTAFNVNARNADSVVVSVTRGRVKVSSITDETKSIILTAGQSAYFAHNEFSAIKGFFINALAWKQRELMFNATPLKEVITTLGSYFDTTLLLDTKYNNQQLTVKLKEPKIDSVLKLITIMYNLKTVEKGNTILLTDNTKN